LLISEIKKIKSNYDLIFKNNFEMNSILKTQVDYTYNPDLKSTIEAEDLYHLIIELKKPNPKIEVFKMKSAKPKNNNIHGFSKKSDHDLGKNEVSSFAEEKTKENLTFYDPNNRNIHVFYLFFYFFSL